MLAENTKLRMEGKMFFYSHPGFYKYSTEILEQLQRLAQLIHIFAQRIQVADMFRLHNLITIPSEALSKIRPHLSR